MSNSLYFNGIDLSTYGVIVTQSKWPVTAKPKLDVQAVPYGKGVSQGSYFEPREFSVNIVFNATSLDTLESNINSVTALLAQTTEKSLRFDAFRANQYWLARYTGGLEDVDYLGLFAMQASLNFIAPDPVAYSMTDNTSTVAIDSTSVSFTLADSTSVVPGNYYAKPVYIIKADNGATGIWLDNQTTAEELYIGSLNSGEWLKVDTERMIVEWSVNSGSSWGARMGAVQGTFPTLQAGVTNSINISGVESGGSIETQFRGRYI